jgi:hypothetical protein
MIYSNKSTDLAMRPIIPIQNTVEGCESGL